MTSSEAVNTPTMNTHSADLNNNTSGTTIAMDTTKSTNTTSTMKIESISAHSSNKSLGITNNSDSNEIEEEKKQDQVDLILGPSSPSTMIDSTTMNRHDSSTSSKDDDDDPRDSAATPAISIKTYLSETDKSRERLRKLRERRLERGESPVLTPKSGTLKNDGTQSEAAAEAGTEIFTPKSVRIESDGTQAEADSIITTPKVAVKETDEIEADTKITTPEASTTESDGTETDTKVGTDMELNADLDTDVKEQHQQQEKGMSDDNQNIHIVNDDSNQANLEPEIKNEEKEGIKEKQEDNPLNSDEIKTAANGMNTLDDNSDDNNKENVATIKEEKEETAREKKEDTTADDRGSIQVAKTGAGISSNNLEKLPLDTMEEKEDDNSIKVHEPVAMKPIAILPQINRQNEIGLHAEMIPIAIERKGVFHVNNSATTTAFERFDASTVNQQIPIPMNTRTGNSSINTSPLEQVLLTPHGSGVLAHPPSISHVPSQEQIALPQPMYVPVTRNNVVHPVQFSAPVPQQPARRSMTLRLQEEIRVHAPIAEGSATKKKTGILSRISRRRAKSHSVGDDNEVTAVHNNHPIIKTKDRGNVSVSWYAGTTSTELQDHVKNCVERKLSLGSKKLLRNFRVIDVSVQPSEEIVLSSYIPNGSEFLCRFRLKDNTFHWTKPRFRAPDSPSAAPSPPGELERLQEQIKAIVETEGGKKSKLMLPNIMDKSRGSMNREMALATPKANSPSNDVVSHNEILSQRLEKLSETLLRLHEDGPYSKVQDERPVEKRQVVFMIANYFILFLSLIAISAEIHERAPRWISWIDENVTSVQNCAADRDALFECVSQGDFSGLIASIILWASTSVATKRLFLFGFDSPSKLWTVVYEAGVSAFCWGVSYMFIRRGLNPDTRPNFISRYWKDAVYGSLSGFNAAFMKAVLKNLISQEQVLDVLDQRQLRIVTFLEKLFSPGT